MRILNFFNINLLLLLLFFTFLNTSVKSEEKKIESIIDQIQIITKDLKTLEKVVYKSSDVTSTSHSSDSLNEDILTKHLLKLNEIEDQFRELTNRFEEINFKLDKLSNRVSKIQSDTQLRITDLEKVNQNNLVEGEEKKVSLPGTDKAQDFGAAEGYEKASSLPKTQQTQSIESAATVITEEAEKTESILPDKPPKEQYEFAVSFIKIGDYETAEFALKEFIDKNTDHDLAGNAQYWYGETFRIRQLYSDAASAYLDGYQNYPKSKKAPINLLKLGITMVQLGEKDQGCAMIVGIKKQYPKASKSVLQKAQYEQKKFKCAKS
jgi:tol-pal system protein YbgF